MHSATAHHEEPHTLPLPPPKAKRTPQPTPHLYTEHDGTWYGIAPWLVRVSCPGCDPSQVPVKINSIPAEPRTMYQMDDLYCRKEVL